MLRNTTATLHLALVYRAANRLSQVYLDARSSQHIVALQASHVCEVMQSSMHRVLAGTQAADLPIRR